MSVHERRLAIACRETRQGVIRLINLVEGRASDKAAARNHGADGALLDDLNGYLRRTEELSEAALRAPCLGVVGLANSGAGALAEALVEASAEQGFVIHTPFAAEPFDYRTALAPPPTALGRAATQRFQSRAASNSSRMPLALALLKPTDIVMVLVRLYAADIAHAKDPRLDTDDLRRSVIALGQHLGLFVIPGMATADVFTIRDHVNALYGTRQRYRVLEAAGFWQSAAAMVTHLPNSARGTLLSPLWGGVSSLTTVFVELMDALDALGYADEVLAPIETVARVERSSLAAVPRADTIISGETALGFAAGNPEVLDVQTRSRLTARITRSALAALTHEVRWHIKSRPGSLLSRCDILQLPEIPASAHVPIDAQRSGHGSPEMSAAFHRAKVTHIFRRAALSHELTSLTVAVGVGVAARPSHRLAPIVAEWVALAQGAEASERAQSDPALVIAVTDAADFAGRVVEGDQWDEQVDTAIDTVLGVVDQNGAKHWVPGRGFDNVALVGRLGARAGTGPTGQALKVQVVAGPPTGGPTATQQPKAIRQLANGAATAVNRDRAVRLARPVVDRAGTDQTGDHPADEDTQFRHFIASAGVRAHVRNPYVAWDDLIGPSGGVDRVIALVEPVADAIVKQRHVAEDLSSTCRELKYLVERHLYRAQSLYGRLNRRHREALIVVTRLRRPDVQGKLGSVLKALQLSEGELTDALYNFEMRPRLETTLEPATGDHGAKVARRTIGDGRAPTGLDGQSFARAAVGQWFNRLRTVARSPEISQEFGISCDSLLTLSEELVAGAARNSLVERLARRIEPLLSTSDDPYGRASMVALQAIEIIGSFITELDGGRRPAVRDDHWRQNLPAPAFGPDTDRVAHGGRSRSLEERVCRFHDTWCLAFLELVRRNASEGPTFDPLADGKEELGDLLKLFSFYAVEWGL